MSYNNGEQDYIQSCIFTGKNKTIKKSSSRVNMEESLSQLYFTQGLISRIQRRLQKIHDMGFQLACCEYALLLLVKK